MNDDTISRQAAIDALDEYIEEYSYDLDENGYHNPKWCAMQEGKTTIQRLPSAERWIPVTDRLPGREGMYLVTSLDGGLHVETTKWFFTTFDGGFFLCDLERNSVVAWMPLPEPYKEGEAE